jgi:hypothetical protein
MNLFTLQIGGRPVAAIRAEDLEQAQELIEDDSFQDDLQELEVEDGTLWDGAEPLTLRPANAEEKAAFDKSWEQGVAEGEIDEDDENLHVVFLVAVYETDDEDEEDEDDEEEDEDDKPAR